MIDILCRCSYPLWDGKSERDISWEGMICENKRDTFIQAHHSQRHIFIHLHVHAVTLQDSFPAASECEEGSSLQGWTNCFPRPAKVPPTNISSFSTIGVNKPLLLQLSFQILLFNSD